MFDDDFELGYFNMFEEQKITIKQQQVELFLLSGYYQTRNYMIFKKIL